MWVDIDKIWEGALQYMKDSGMSQEEIDDLVSKAAVALEYYYDNPYEITKKSIEQLAKIETEVEFDDEQ